MSQLNRAQQLAVTAPERNILVSAGAGTGKTRVLVDRFLHCVREGGSGITEILALTFTDKAANEMKTRIAGHLNPRERRELESAYISTVHAFASRLLREHPLEAGVDPHFRVVEEEEADFFKEQALDDVLEQSARRGTPAFDLLRLYGENAVRQGLQRLLEVARHEGRDLADYFTACRERAASRPPLPCPESLFETVEAAEELKAWQAFVSQKTWNWQTLEEFQTWFSGFARRGGKKHRDSWKAIKAICEQTLARRLEVLAEPLQAVVEELALAYEQGYEALKQERGFLDFSDLERLTLRLLRAEDPLRRRIREKYRRQFRHILIDEFQDTNPVQWELVNRIARGDNLFTVGDYKQSIYRFRGAEPELILNCERIYEQEKKGTRIPLQENYRTAAPVLEFINGFFENLWQEEAVRFDALLPTVVSEPWAGVGILKTVRGEDEALDRARMREAEGIARQMQRLHEDEGIEFGRMAILFDAMSQVGIYEHVLRAHGIPYYVLSGRGFYQQPEIRDMISFLSFLENPLADIPLAASLRSPLFQVRDDTLVWLAQKAKQADETVPLYHGVKAFREIEKLPEEERQKLERFLDIAGELLQSKDRLRLTELLDRILERTAYELTVLADPQGVRRYANLKKMIGLAREFEFHEPMPVGAFLRTLRRLETQEARESEARVEAEESGQVVQLMTIHRSKGLEFDVVFIADLGRLRQHAGDSSKLLAAEPGQGYGLKVMPESGSGNGWATESWTGIQEGARTQDRKEQKRRLYVAMTRARQKLILSGVVDEARAAREGNATWMEWVLAADPEGQRVLPEAPARPRRARKAFAEKKEIHALLEAALEGTSAPVRLPRELKAKGTGILARLDEKPVLPARVIDLPVSAYAAYQKSPVEYRRLYEIGVPEKQSEDLRMEEAAREAEADVPAAEFGTAMHALLERLDFSRPERNRQALLEECFSAFPVAAREEAAVIVDNFLKSDLFSQLAGASRIRREIPFWINERHGLIHGIIDVLFQDARGRWHVLDYKSALGSDEKVAGAYELQIRLYAHAVQELLDIQPASGILYFLKNGWTWTQTLTPAAMQENTQHIRHLQEEILNYRNQ